MRQSTTKNGYKAGMRIVAQRVGKASVRVRGEVVSVIGKGLLLLVGVDRDDKDITSVDLARKISRLRIFPDDSGKMNLDIRQVNGEILSVPQFTLVASTSEGNRPAFDRAAGADIAERLWETLNEELFSCGIAVKKGMFGAEMSVNIENEGPVTFVLDM